ncbi:hypothetical protein C2S51_000909 [Perilla frutescens var. frutescens]|nr:hypothetical protein C2S51_000909 [Perilla frutescens var. frutescens]
MINQPAAVMRLRNPMESPAPPPPKGYVHYQHTDACSLHRWNAKESYEFMYARSWQKVNEFYLDLANGRQSLPQLFGKETYDVHTGAEIVEDFDTPESASVQVKGRTGRWARVTFKILISYHGNSFDGWQKQPGLNTVQGLVEKSIGKFVDERKAQLLKEKKLPIEGNVLVAGRTDKGVTALGQVCSFYTWRKDVKVQDIEDAINAAAPGKIRVTSVSQVLRDFHPNFSAKWRRYFYIFPFNDENMDDEVSEWKTNNLNKAICHDGECDKGLGEQNCEDEDDDYDRTQQAGSKPPTFEVSRVNHLLQQLEGKLLSFRMFARDTKASRNIGPPTECFIFHARAAEAYLPCPKDGVSTKVMCIELVANRFLRKMVRVLVATAVREAAAGAEEDALIKLLDATCRRATAPPAPSDGLCLVDVGSSSRGLRATPKCAHHHPYAIIAMAYRKLLLSNSHALLILITTLLHLAPPSLTQSPEADTLLKLKASLTENGTLSNWINPLPPCTGASSNWAGVSCDDRGTVVALQLQTMGLGGTIDVDALAQLPNLLTVSFAGNNFTGPLPRLAALPNVKELYLSNNKMSGVIPANAFQGMVGLTKLHLDNNQFSGPIPTSLSGLPWLSELMLENNGFQGPIPPFPKGQLRNFSVANNAVSGEIPYGLSFDASAFSGNRELCGTPLAACERPHAQRLSVGTIILVSILITAALAALITVIIILCRRRRAPPHQPEKEEVAGAGAGQEPRAQDLDEMERGQAAPGPSSAGISHQRKKSEPNVKITFLKEGMETFDMTDLLKASAEILGSGVFGSSYKAAVTETQIVVVKRYRHMNNVSKQDFTEHMRRLGRLNHPNVLPLLGFYYRREEKLLVYQYVPKSSLAAHLHGNRSRDRDGRKCPDWATRLSIAKGVARGLLCLHNELPSLTAAHGHLKSSNVLLDASYTPSLTDYGLVPIVNQEHAEQHMISYKSPEYKSSGRITKKTDVWSLGILLLEILTGRLFPSNFLKQGKVGGGEEEATAWVEAVAKDEEKGEDVFDADMARDEQCEGEMMKLLRIGFECCQIDVEKRPDIKEVAHKIEELRERGGFI